jgi:curved DNA-binding protein CbpA
MAATHYEALGVPEDASTEAIKAAWRRIALECHPDRSAGDAAKRARFLAANAAQEVLLDPERRAKYDEEVRRVRNPFLVAGRCERCGRRTLFGVRLCVACAKDDLARQRAAEHAARAAEAAQEAERELAAQRLRAAAAAARQARAEARRARPKAGATPRRGARARVLSEEQARLEAEFGGFADSSTWPHEVEDYMQPSPPRADDLLQALLGDAAIRTARRRAQKKMRSQLRVTVDLGGEPIVLDDATFRAVQDIGRSLGKANRLMTLLRRWFG